MQGQSLNFIWLDITSELVQIELDSVALHDLIDPALDVTYFCVHTVLHRASASMIPTSSSFQEPSAIVLTDQRTATIALASIDSTLIKSCTQHGVVDHVRVTLKTPRNIKQNRITQNSGSLIVMKSWYKLKFMCGWSCLFLVICRTK